MPRSSPPDVRGLLLERAAEMLARREPVTLRALVADTGTSTMAVYTHFGGMPGLWRSVRQEGLTRLSRRLAEEVTSDDPLRDVAALAAAYTSNAMAAPALYRAMFDDAVDLDDPEAAAVSFRTWVERAERARASGRVAPDTDAEALATRLWAAGHGLVLLVIGGVLPPAVLDVHGPATVTDLLVAAGAERGSAERSVARGWDLAARHPAS